MPPCPRRRLPVVLAAACLAAVSPPAAAGPAAADPLVPPRGQVLTGFSGGYALDPFRAQTGHDPSVLGIFVTWGSLGDYAFDIPRRTDTTLMLHVSTTNGYGAREVITPRAIARGRGDAYLLRLNRRIADENRPVYVRLLAEMNQANNAYAGFDRDGSPRGRSHSPAAFRDAWRRATLILRGGSVASVDRRLRRLRLPAVRGAPADGVLARPRIAMAWVPQTRGTPDIPANMPVHYWPGPAYVDWVGTDFYSRFPRFDWLDDFYRRFGGKPFMLAEWALWGADDPAFVRRLFAWADARKRVKLLLYNQGFERNGPFRLNRHPRARAELRRQLARPRFR